MTSLGTSAASGLFLQGHRESDRADVRASNVTAAIAVANFVKSSLGPTGLDKMLVDEIGDVTVTNDGATILQQLDVLQHPAARLLVDLARQQDQEVGDGTTSVVLLAAELLKRGQQLLQQAGGSSSAHGGAIATMSSQGQLHPTAILSGYRLALKAAVAYIKQHLAVPVSSLSNDHLLQAAETSMSSKLIGSDATSRSFFAHMAVQAVQSVATTRDDDGDDIQDNNVSQPKKKNTKRYPLSAIHIIKAHGQSAMDSYLIHGGYALAAGRAAQGMPTAVHAAAIDASSPDGAVKIAMLDMNLQRHRMAMGITMQVVDPAEIERIAKHELDLTKQKIEIILSAGAQVVLVTKGVDDVCCKYLVERGVLCARRIAREDLRRLAKATGGQLVTTLADLDGNLSLDPASLGRCRSVQEVRVGDSEMLHFDQVQGAGASTIVLRGPHEYYLDEMDRALHDAISVVKRMLESASLVAGGGAVEVALSVYLEDYATRNLPTREQLAVQAFAEAVLCIPKQLAVNAALDSTELVAELRSIHAQGQQKQKQQMQQQQLHGDKKNTVDDSDDHDDDARFTGLDLMQGTVRNNLLAGVVEPAMSKIKALRFATEAAVTILRIDDRITVTPDSGK